MKTANGKSFAPATHVMSRAPQYSKLRASASVIRHRCAYEHVLGAKEEIRIAYSFVSPHHLDRYASLYCIIGELSQRRGFRILNVPVSVLGKAHFRFASTSAYLSAILLHDCIYPS